MHPGPHSRSRLAGLLRPDVAEESARKTLRDALYELRRAFAPAEPVAATRESVELRAEVDLGAFRALRAAGELERCAEIAGFGRPAAGDGDGSRRRQIAAAGGELLAGLDADWTLRARGEHAADVTAVLVALAERAEATGDLPDAIAWSRPWSSTSRSPRPRTAT